MVKARYEIMKISIRQILILLAGSLASYNFGLAGGYIEGKPGQVSLGGLIMGVVVNLTIAVLASALGSIKGKNRRKQAYFGMWVLMAVSPVMVGPSIYYLLGESFLTEIPRGLYSLFWASLPDIAIFAAGASNGSKGVLKLDAEIYIPLSKGKPESKVEPASNPKPASKPKPQAVKSKRATKSKPKPTPKPASKGKVNLDLLLKNWRKLPNITDAKMAAKFGVKRQAINGRRLKMIKDGIIEMTPDGVKVL